MATKIFNQLEVVLQDDTTITLKPLVIGRLRRFMSSWERMKDVQKETDSFDIFVDCAGIAIEDNFTERFAEDGTVGKNKYLSDSYKTYLEGVLDMDTIYKIMEVCGGMKLNDPNLLAAAAEVAGRS